MKSQKALYHKIYDFDNLLLAFQNARKGKRSKPNVAQFEFGFEKELLRLQHELKAQSYKPGQYKTFLIFDPKKRMISAAPFRDRVVHHALCNIIEPIFERSLIYDSYANRKGKGTHAAILRCQKFIGRYPFVLKADIQKYFPSIDHTILKQIIRRKIACKATLWLIDLIIDNSNPQLQIFDYFPTDDLFSPIRRRKGLPMGNLTSQFFANNYLSSFDHYVKEELRMKAYIRYVDDFVLLADSKQTLHETRPLLEGFLAKKLRLHLHPNKTIVSPSKVGVNFLGQRIFASHRLLLKTNVRKNYKRLNQRIEAYKTGKLSAEKLECQLNAWLGHAKQADTYRLRKSIYKQIRYEYGIELHETYHGTWKILEPPS